MPYSLPASVGALVWAVNEPARLRHPSRGSRRARRRGLSQTVSRVERSAEHRRSLSDLHELSSSFRRSLDEAQRQRWLVLEDALLAFSERSSHAYYHAGFRCGVEWSVRSRASSGGDACSAREARGGHRALDPTGAGPRWPAIAPRPSSEARADAASSVRLEAEAALGAGVDCLAALARLLLAVTKR
jgi:hypothetical protein